MAVRGTPDTTGTDNGTTHCNTDNLVPGLADTGSRSSCISDFGAFDMVGNLWEWVADWVPQSNACGSWPSGYGGDTQCLAGAATTGAPGALLRGGEFSGIFSWDAGPFAVDASDAPAQSLSSYGFRGAR